MKKWKQKIFGLFNHHLKITDNWVEESPKCNCNLQVVTENSITIYIILVFYYA